MKFEASIQELRDWIDICRHLLLKLTLANTQFAFSLSVDPFLWQLRLISHEFSSITHVNRKPFNNKTGIKHLGLISLLSPDLIISKLVACNFTKMLNLCLKQPSPIWARVSFAVMLLSIALASWLIRNRGSENIVKEVDVEENDERPSRLPRIDPIQVRWTLRTNFKWSCYKTYVVVLLLLSLNNIHKTQKISLLVYAPGVLTFWVKHCPYKMQLFKANFDTIQWKSLLERTRVNSG